MSKTSGQFDGFQNRNESALRRFLNALKFGGLYGHLQAICQRNCTVRQGLRPDDLYGGVVQRRQADARYVENGRRVAFYGRRDHV
jgi:hypothetical protein